MNSMPSSLEPAVVRAIELTVEHIAQLTRAPYVAFVHRPQSGSTVGPIVCARKGVRVACAPMNLIDDVLRTRRPIVPPRTPRSTNPLTSRSSGVPNGLALLPVCTGEAAIGVLCIAGAPWLARLPHARLKRLFMVAHHLAEILQGPPRARWILPERLDGRIVYRWTEVGDSVPALPAPLALLPDPCSAIIGRSRARERLVERVRQVGESDADALITGESGSGKELAAVAIHRISRRRSKPFVAVNCAALAETLLESELFGHVEGAFTDAHRERKGNFEAAQGGILFLDEIGDASPALQKKLLRALQERVTSPVGSDKDVRVDVRVLCATNKCLASEVAAGRFRHDLYHRIACVKVDVPPLSRRREDIPLIVAARLPGIACELRKAWSVQPLLETASLDLIAEADWPGSFREVLGFVKDVLVTLGARPKTAGIAAMLLDLGKRGPSAAEEQRFREIREIDEAFAICQGRLNAAALYLGITPRGLRQRMERLEHDPRRNGKELSPA